MSWVYQYRVRIWMVNVPQRNFSCWAPLVSRTYSNQYKRECQVMYVHVYMTMKCVYVCTCYNGVAGGSVLKALGSCLLQYALEFYIVPPGANSFSDKIRNPYPCIIGPIPVVPHAWSCWTFLVVKYWSRPAPAASLPIWVYKKLTDYMYLKDVQFFVYSRI